MRGVVGAFACFFLSACVLVASCGGSNGESLFGTDGAMASTSSSSGGTGGKSTVTSSQSSTTGTGGSGAPDGGPDGSDVDAGDGGYIGSCAHDPCATGDAMDGTAAPLNPSCDPCVAFVCSQTESCCSVTWGPPCANAYSAYCGAGDGGTYSYCAHAGTCVHDICVTGAPLDILCNPCVTFICETSGDQGCCSAEWIDLCVSYVTTACGVICQ